MTEDVLDKPGHEYLRQHRDKALKLNMQQVTSACSAQCLCGSRPPLRPKPEEGENIAAGGVEWEGVQGQAFKGTPGKGFKRWGYKGRDD